MVIGLVLAAGRGSRFADVDPSGPSKMLALVDGVPMVRRTVSSLVAGGVARVVVVVTREGRDEISMALRDLPARFAVNPDPSRGMFSSIQCGLRVTRAADPVAILPGDMPFVQPWTIEHLVAEAKRTGLTTSPIYRGHHGHPVVCSPALRTRLIAAPVDSMLSAEMAHERLHSVQVEDDGVARDVDRPGDLEGAKRRRHQA